MSRTEVLGVPIDVLTPHEAIMRLRVLLHAQGQHHIMTPNNEMLVMASNDPAFKKLMHRTAINLPDSGGVVWAMRRNGAHIHSRVTGIDTVESLCKILEGPEESVFLLGAGPGIAESAAAVLKARNPHLVIAGAYSGTPKEADAAAIVEKINASDAKFLLVAYGAPQQDFWIDRFMKAMPSVKVAMGVGGTFDFISGNKSRAPKIIQKMGFEWLWRFIQEPSRYKRMWTACVVYRRLVHEAD